MRLYLAQVAMILFKMAVGGMISGTQGNIIMMEV